MAGFCFAAFVASFGDEKNDFAAIFRTVFQHARRVDDGVVHGGGGRTGVDFGEGFFEECAVVGKVLHDALAMVEGEDGGFAFFAEDEAFEEGAYLLDFIEDGFDGVVGLDADDDVEGLESEFNFKGLFFAAIDEAELVRLQIGDVAAVLSDGGRGHDVPDERFEYGEVAFGLGGGLILPKQGRA